VQLIAILHNHKQNEIDCNGQVRRGVGISRLVQNGDGITPFPRTEHLLKWYEANEQCDEA
jgi:hypothetical protein